MGQIVSAQIRWLFVERVLSVECKQVSCTSGEETMKTDVSKTNTREGAQTYAEETCYGVC